MDSVCFVYHVSDGLRRVGEILHIIYKIHVIMDSDTKGIMDSS